MIVQFYFRAKLPPAEYTNCILTGKRYTADEGYKAGIVHAVHPGNVLLDRAIEFGLTIAKEDFDRDTLSQLKNGLYHHVLEAVVQPMQMYSKL